MGRFSKIFKTPEIWIFLLFIIVLSLFLYPAILQPNSIISGGGGGDDFGTIYEMWLQRNNHNQWLNTGNANIYPIRSLIITQLSKFLSEIRVYNLLNWLSFPLTAIGMYFLVFYVTRSRLASFISGLIYTFSPYHFIRATGHLTLAHVEWIPLCALFLFKMVETKKYRYAVLAGAFFSLNFFTDYYYGLFLSVFVVVFFAVWVFVGFKNPSLALPFKKGENQSSSRLPRPFTKKGGVARTVIKPTLIFGLLSMLLIGSYLGWIFFSGGQETQKMATSFSRPIGDLYHWGGSLKYYFIPWQENYLFGDFWNKIFYQGNGIPDGEWLAYLGWPGILLAGYGVWRWGRERRGSRLGRRGDLARTVRDSHFDFIMILFTVTAIFATIFSFAPPLSPSKWIYKILPQFRVYARFFVFVSLAVSVLAGVGLKYLFEALKSLSDSPFFKGREPVFQVYNRFKIYLFILILIVVLVDFAPSFKTTDISKVPQEYVWLKNLPDEGFSTQHQNQINPSLTLPLQKGENQFGTGQASSNSNVSIVIAEYPYVASSHGPTPTYLFWQRIHQKPMINGQSEPDTTGKEKIRGLIYDVTNPRTPRILKKLGAKYLILHKDQYNQPYWPNTPVPSDKKLPKKVKMAEINPGLKLVKRFNLTYVYEIR